jgi:hypothetical protein
MWPRSAALRGITMRLRVGTRREMEKDTSAQAKTGLNASGIDSAAAKFRRLTRRRSAE